MTEKEPIGWFTTANGKHIPIFEREMDPEEQKKDREIRKNKEQADKLNGKSKNVSFNDIQEDLNSDAPDYEKIATDINDAVETAGYFSFEKDGKTTVYGKAWNDAFFDLTPESKDGVAKRLLDSVAMAKTIKANTGTWEMHKYDGQVKFPAKLLNKKAPDVAMLNAIVLRKAPTNARLEKITSTPEYDIYAFKNAGTDMFQYIAVKK